MLEIVLEEISFEGPEPGERSVEIDAAMVTDKLGELIQDQDLSRFIL